MTADKARKSATRQRMAETGEPYSVARHAVHDDAGAADDPGPADQAGHRAYEARAAAEQARWQAERAIELAGEAAAAAEQAEEAAHRAGELAGDGDIDDDRDAGGAGVSGAGLPGWHRRPPMPPRPPHPPHPHHHAHHGPDDHHQRRDPAERLQDRVEQVIQRFEMMRDRADQLIRAAERIFPPPGRPETTHKEPEAAEPD